MERKNMSNLTLYVFGLILGFVISRMIYNKPAEGEIFIINQEDKENPDVYVAINNIEDIKYRNTIQMKVHNNTQK